MLQAQHADHYAWQHAIGALRAERQVAALSLGRAVLTYHQIERKWRCPCPSMGSTGVKGLTGRGYLLEVGRRAEGGVSAAPSSCRADGPGCYAKTRPDAGLRQLVHLVINAMLYLASWAR